jgi:hypothetical protein
MLLKTALNYAERGYSVIPVIGKRCPLSWSGYQVKAATYSHIHNWHNRGLLKGVAIVCGDVSNNLVVIDLDGNAQVTEFEATFPHLVKTYGVLTGSGRGKHYYYTVDTLPPTTRHRGFELRANGCYVVAPPSLHPDTGQAYKSLWPIRDVMHLPHLDQVKDWIMGKIHANQAAARPAQNGKRAIYGAYAARALQSEIAALNRVTEGGFNDALNRAAFNLGQLVPDHLTRSDVENALYDTALSCGYVARDGERQTWRTIQSGLEAGIRNPRSRRYAR